MYKWEYARIQAVAHEMVKVSDVTHSAQQLGHSRDNTLDCSAVMIEAASGDWGGLSMNVSDAHILRKKSSPNDLHVVLGASAGASLRHALGRRSGVFPVWDHPELGPLGNGVERAAFWNELYKDELYADTFDEWRDIVEQIGERAPERIIIWTDMTGSGIVFLRMAAHFLSKCQVGLWRIVAPPFGDGFSIGIFPAEILRPLLDIAEPISQLKANKLGQEFVAIADRPEPLRIARENGELSFQQIDYFDQQLLGYVNFEWARALHPVSMTMGYADPRNPPGDILLTDRLRHMSVAGQIEARGNLDGSLRDFEVRLPATSSG
jgi:hypothetical protein